MEDKARSDTRESKEKMEIIQSESDRALEFFHKSYKNTHMQCAEKISMMDLSSASIEEKILSLIKSDGIH